MSYSGYTHQQRSSDHLSLQELENEFKDEVASLESDDFDTSRGQNSGNRAYSKGELNSSLRDKKSLSQLDVGVFPPKQRIANAFPIQTKSEDKSVLSPAPWNSNYQPKSGGEMSFQEMQAVKQKEKLAYRRGNTRPGAVSIQARSEDSPVATLSVAEASRKSSIQSRNGGKMSFNEMQAVKKREKLAFKRKNSSPGAFSVSMRIKENLVASPFSVTEASRKSSKQSRSGGRISIEEMEDVKQREISAYKREDSVPGAFSSQPRLEGNSMLSSSVAEATNKSIMPSRSVERVSIEDMEAIKVKEKEIKSSVQLRSGGRTSLEEMEGATQKEMFSYNRSNFAPTTSVLPSCPRRGEKSQMTSLSRLQPGAMRVEYSKATKVIDSSDEVSGMRDDLQTLERDALAKRGKYAREGMPRRTDGEVLTASRDLRTLEKNVTAKTSRYQKKAQVMNPTPESTININSELQKNELASKEDAANGVIITGEEHNENRRHNDENHSFNSKKPCFNLLNRKRNLFLLLFTIGILVVIITLVFVFKGNHDESTVEILSTASTTTLPEKPSFEPIKWGSEISIKDAENSIGATLGFMEELLVASNGIIVQAYNMKNSNPTKIGRYLDGENVHVSSNSSRVAVKVNEMVKVYEFSNNDWVQIGEDIIGIQPEQSISISGDGLTIAISALLNRSGRCATQIFRFDGEWERLGNNIEHYDVTAIGNSLSDDGDTIILGYESPPNTIGFSFAYKLSLSKTPAWRMVITKRGGYTGGPNVHMSGNGDVVLTGGGGIVQAFSIEGNKFGESYKSYDSMPVAVLSRESNYVAIRIGEKRIALATISEEGWQQHKKISGIQCSSISSLAFSGYDKLAIGCGPEDGFIQVFKMEN